MKYCLSGRQPKSVLAKADEIKMKYSDFGRMLDYIIEWPDKTFILDIPKTIDIIDWDQIQSIAEENKLIVCLENINLSNECATRDIAWYWSYPITSWYELDGVIKLNPCYLFLGAPLSFSLDKVAAKTSAAIRLCPNLAYDAYIPRDNGLYGTWIRPEDLAAYEQYVSTVEFITESMREEASLYHIYHDNGNWPGNLNLLFKNFNINVDNRAIPEEAGKMRMTCGQRCMEAGTCHFCDTAIKFAAAIRDKHYNDLREKRNLMDASEEI